MKGKIIRCIVCEEEYSSSLGCCPKCQYPALFLSKRPGRQKKAVEAYREEIGIAKIPDETIDVTAVIDKYNSDTKDTVIKNPPKPKNKGRMLVAAAVAVVVIAIALSASGVFDPPEPEPADDTTTTTEEAVNEEAEEAVPEITAEEALSAFISDVINNSNEYNDDNPITYGEDGDPITWEKYAIDDFDGDGEVELLVLRSYYRLTDGLTLYEYENGSVVEKRTSWFMASLDNAVFYSNAIVMESYDAVVDSGNTLSIFLLDDRYTDEFNVIGRSFLKFVHDPDGNIWYSKAPGWDQDVDEIQISQDQYEEYMNKLTRDENYASYWQVQPTFKDVKR